MQGGSTYNDPYGQKRPQDVSRNGGLVQSAFQTNPASPSLSGTYLNYGQQGSPLQSTLAQQRQVYPMSGGYGQPNQGYGQTPFGTYGQPDQTNNAPNGYLEVHHYLAREQEYFCCSLTCIFLFDILFLIGLISALIRLSLDHWGWWFAAALFIPMFFFAIYILVVACGEKRNDSTLMSFTSYSCARLTTNTVCQIMYVVFMILAIVCWCYSNSKQYQDDGSATAYSFLGWLYFICALSFAINII